jgi:hypothetical protein
LEAGSVEAGRPRFRVGRRRRPRAAAKPNVFSFTRGGEYF